ncbi:MAG: hypothetical protein FJW26_08610 [Acidimicrobiia bacterium]|nr:hypothetical protein [Acidimicrobiia bacterium]
MGSRHERQRVGAHLENPFNTPYLYLQGGGDSPGFREIRTLTVNTSGADKGNHTGARYIRFQARLEF